MPTHNDGVIEIPTNPNSNEESEMDPAVLAALQTESFGNIQMTNTNARNTSQEVNAVLARSSARKFDEREAAESRAISGIMATPIASPATQ